MAPHETPASASASTYATAATATRPSPLREQVGPVGVEGGGAVRHEHPGAPGVEVLAACMARAIVDGRGQAGVVATADERAQVDLGQHALADQAAVDLMEGFLDEVRKFFVQHPLQDSPDVMVETCRAPGGGHRPRQHMGPEDVGLVEFVAVLEHGDAGAQVVELPRGTVHDRQRQPRTDDFALDGGVIDQAQATTATARPLSSMPGRVTSSRAVGLRTPQEALKAVHPQGAMAGQVFDRLTPALHQGRIGHLA